MKFTSLLLFVVVCVMFVGCARISGPVEQVKAYVDEKEDTLVQMGKKLDANPGEVGFDDAKKVFESKKESLKAKKAAIESAPQGMNTDWQSLLRTTEARHEKMFSEMGTNFTIKCSNPEECRTKWSQLEKEFKEIATKF